MPERKTRLALLGLCWSAFVLRANSLAYQSLWRDEVDAVRFASQSLGELLAMFSSPGQNGPLYYLLLRPWLHQAGQSEFALRYFSLFFGVLSVPLIYRLARWLFPSLGPVALLSALLATTSPYLIWYSQEGKMYALVVFLSLLSMDRFLTALTKGGWLRWLTYAIVTSAAFYVHLVAVLLIAVQFVAFFFQGRQCRSRSWRPWLTTLIALALPYLPLLAWQASMLLDPAQTGFRFVTLPELLLSLLGTFSLGVAQGITPWSAVPFLAALLAAVLLWVDDRAQASALATLLCWFLLPVVLLFLITLAYPLYTARYLIFILPAYLLLMAAGLVAVGRRSLLSAGVLLAALLVMSGRGIWLQSTRPIKADFRSVANYVMGNASPGDLIVFQIPYGRHSFEYYAKRQGLPQPALQREPGFDVASSGRSLYQAYLPFLAAGTGYAYRWAEGLYTNAGMEPAEVVRRMTELVSNSGIVWLVATETEMWDRRGLVQSWLSDQADLVDSAHFVRVSVYRYELP